MRNEILRRNGLCTHVSAIIFRKIQRIVAFTENIPRDTRVFAGSFLGGSKRREGREGGKGRRGEMRTEKLYSEDKWTMHTRKRNYSR